MGRHNESDTSSISCNVVPSSPMGVKKELVSRLKRSSTANKCWYLGGISYLTATIGINKLVCLSSGFKTFENVRPDAPTTTSHRNVLSHTSEDLRNNRHHLSRIGSNNCSP